MKRKTLGVVMLIIGVILIGLAFLANINPSLYLVISKWLIGIEGLSLLSAGAGFLIKVKDIHYEEPSDVE